MKIVSLTLQFKLKNIDDVHNLFFVGKHGMIVQIKNNIVG